MVPNRTWSVQQARISVQQRCVNERERERTPFFKQAAAVLEVGSDRIEISLQFKLNGAMGNGFNKVKCSALELVMIQALCESFLHPYLAVVCPSVSPSSKNNTTDLSINDS